MSDPKAGDMNKQSVNRNQVATSILLATAFLIGALVIMQAGRLPQQSAFAGDAITGAEGFTMITASSGFGKDTRPYELCFVLDNYSDMMFVYEVPQSTSRSVVLRNGTDLPYLFGISRPASK